MSGRGGNPRDGMVVDNMEAQTRLLQELVRMMGDKEFGLDGPMQETEISGTQAAGHTLMDPRAYVVRESDDLDGLDPGDPVTLSPGETKTLVDFQSQNEEGFLLLAIGATDHNNVQYRLRLDDDFVMGGTTNSPLGVINNAFSFEDALGAAVPVDKYAEYEAHYSANGSGDINLAGRMHVQQL